MKQISNKLRPAYLFSSFPLPNGWPECSALEIGWQRFRKERSSTPFQDCHYVYRKFFIEGLSILPCAATEAVIS